MQSSRTFFFVVLLSSLLRVHGQELKFAELGDFRVESGEVIHNCRVGYRTFGKLDSRNSNAILLPTWAGGTSEQLKGSVGEHSLLDPKYFVIAVDALSNGVSSSPSNSVLQPHMKFPKITIHDMVQAEHRLLVETMGIKHLKAVVGVSMGGIQTFDWIVSYPDFMDKAIPIVGSPRLAPYDVLHMQTEIDVLENDPRWNGGEYAVSPAARIEFELGAMILTSPERYNHQETREQVFADLDAAGKSPGADANNKIRQVEAMIALDVAKAFHGSMEKAAATVRAKVLIIASKFDHVITPQPALDFAALLHCDVIELESDCGHSFGACDNQKVSEALARFLAN